MSVVTRQTFCLCMSVFLLMDAFLQPILARQVHHRILDARGRTGHTGTDNETGSRHPANYDQSAATCKWEIDELFGTSYC